MSVRVGDGIGGVRPPHARPAEPRPAGAEPRDLWEPVARSGPAPEPGTLRPPRTLRELFAWFHAREHFAFGAPVVDVPFVVERGYPVEYRRQEPNTITLGFEHEGERPGGEAIPEDPVRDEPWGVYRHWQPPPEVISSEDWEKLRIEERAAVAQDIPYERLQRSPGTPAGLKLKTDVDVHETTPTEPSTSLLQFFRRTRWVRKHIEPEGHTQYNIGFFNNPRFAKEVTTYAAQVAEWAKWRNIARDPNAVRNDQFAPYDQDQLRAIEHKLGMELPELDAGYKRSTFALRSGDKYGFPPRIVYELRGITNNVLLARRIVALTVRFLEDPLGTRVRLGRMNRGYTIAEAARLPRLNEGLILQLPVEVRTLLMHMGDFEELKPWLLPLLHWEDRPGVPADARVEVDGRSLTVRQLFEEARSRYEAQLRWITSFAMPDAPDRQSVAPQLDSAVHEFAKQTMVYRYL